MGFVFYDTETTGTSTSFDQILQFAAIHTDVDLNEVDRINVRCRLHRHVLPHPGALCVTGMSIGQITDPSLPSHYEMVRQVREKLIGWSPAIFVGFNSLNFDEHLLRQALFQTLHPPYLTNTDGNCRADVMSLIQAAAACAPQCLQLPESDRGGFVYKLDQVAPLNGFAHEDAHDALGDVLATIHLARCVRDNAPECWSRFVRFAAKASVRQFIEDEDSFVLTAAYFGRVYHYVLALIGFDAEQTNIAYCLDLRHDPAWLATLSDQDLSTLIARSPKPIRKIKINAAPSIAPVYEVPDGLLGGLSVDDIAQRAAALAPMQDLKDRLISLTVEAAPEFESSEHVEEQLYDDFVSGADQQRMAQFHSLSWADRVAHLETLEDPRLRYFGRRLVYAHDPQLLEPQHRADIEQLMRARFHADPPPEKKWLTFAEAINATDVLLESADSATREILVEYRAYVGSRLAVGV